MPAKVLNFLKSTYSPSAVQRLNSLTLEPLSTNFGFDRGGPVDRYYIENFLQLNSNYIKGRVLEIGDNEYTLKYGGAAVLISDILHVHEDNPKATIIGDISNAPNIADNQFDCIILTQTLHLIFEFHKALETCFRILRPGGTLLITVPGITPLDHEEWSKIWYWSFTELSIHKLLAGLFNENNLDIQTFGNVKIATAFLYGMGLPEVKKSELDYKDAYYPVIITARAIK